MLLALWPQGWSRQQRSNATLVAALVVMVLALAQLVADATGPLPMQLASLAVLLPWVAACTRRLRDAGLSPWWQLISLAPVAGILVLLYLCTFPTKAAVPADVTA